MMIVRVFRDILKRTNQQILLGRWNITNEKTNLVKLSMANHDHCGTCGTPITLNESIQQTQPQKIFWTQIKKSYIH